MAFDTVRAVSMNMPFNVENMAFDTAQAVSMHMSFNLKNMAFDTAQAVCVAVIDCINITSFKYQLLIRPRPYQCICHLIWKNGF